MTTNVVFKYYRPFKIKINITNQRLC